MATYKLNIGHTDGKTYKKDLSADESVALLGKRIGDKVKGEPFGFDGYEFLITGGSDYCGFPMRKDVGGAARKRVLIMGGVGLRARREGMRVRKTVAGNTIHEQTVQVNLKVVKAGKTPLGGEALAQDAGAQE